MGTCYGHQTPIQRASVGRLASVGRRNPTDARDGNYNNLHVGLVRTASRLFVSRFLLSNHLARHGWWSRGEPPTTTNLMKRCYFLLWDEKFKGWHRTNVVRVVELIAFASDVLQPSGSPEEKGFFYHLQRAAPKGARPQHSRETAHHRRRGDRVRRVASRCHRQSRPLVQSSS